MHIVAVIYAFTKNWQKRRIQDGILAVLLIGLIFTVGWALTNPLARLIMAKSWESVWFKQDTLSLLLLAIPEAAFFYYFFVKNR
jgi:hypothetical protein